MDSDNRSAAEGRDNDDERFLVESRVEIAFILRCAMNEGAMAVVSFNQGRDSFVTAVLSVDGAAGHYVIDASQDEAVNQRLALASRILFSSYQGKVRIQWEADRARAVSFEGHPAMLIPLPAVLRKYQRREYFRAETPVMRPVQCTIPLEEGRSVVANLFDISLGGVGLTGLPADFPIEIGREFPGCTIVLPEFGVLSVTLQIRNADEVALRDDRVLRRAGCAFVGLPPGADSMIQRYIIRLERDRRYRTS